jgi:hypothetical protein
MFSENQFYYITHNLCVSLAGGWAECCMRENGNKGWCLDDEIQMSGLQNIKNRGRIVCACASHTKENPD